MTPLPSSSSLLTLHALRLKGMGEPPTIARRFSLDVADVAEHLLDFEAYGWVQHFEFAGSGGWTLTDAGRVENERQLAVELVESGAGAEVARAHAEFLPLNSLLPVGVHRLADPGAARLADGSQRPH